MTTSGAVKVGAAFLIGVAAALGTALVYVNEENSKYVQPTVEAASPIKRPRAPRVQPPPDLQSPVQSAAEEDAVSKPMTGEPAPAMHSPEPVTSVDVPPTTENSRPAPPAAKPRTYPQALPPIQIAQNSPRSYPPVSTQPPSSVPESGPTPSVNSNRAPTSVPSPQVQGAPEPAPRVTEAPAPPQPTASVSAPPAVKEFQPHVVQLEPGTNVFVRIAETVSTDHNYAGDTFRATLMQPIVRNGFIIADKGSKVLGRVTTVQRPGRIEGIGDLALTLTEINTTDGQRVRIDTNTFEKRGPSSRAADAVKIAGGAGLGALIGAVGGAKGAAIGAGIGSVAGTAVAYATRTRNAEVPTETAVMFRLTNPVVITEKLRF
jgi:hypothetical protein